jgi:hypothetical protein
MARAKPSVVLPAVEPMMRVMGRFGKAWAVAVLGDKAMSTAQTASPNAPFKPSLNAFSVATLFFSVEGLNAHFLIGMLVS